MTLESKLDLLILEVRNQTAQLKKIVRLLEVRESRNTDLPTPAAMELPVMKDALPQRETVELTPENLGKILKRFPESRRSILVLLFGIDKGNYPYTLEEVAKIYKVTRERIRQISEGAVAKIGRLTNSTKEQVIDALVAFGKSEFAADFAFKTILETHVRELGLSARIRKCLHKLDIQTVGELIQKTGEEFLACENFGELSLNELREKLAVHNLQLRDK